MYLIYSPIGGSFRGFHLIVPIMVALTAESRGIM